MGKFSNTLNSQGTKTIFLFYTSQAECRSRGARGHRDQERGLLFHSVTSALQTTTLEEVLSSSYTLYHVVIVKWFQIICHLFQTSFSVFWAQAGLWLSTALLQRSVVVLASGRENPSPKKAKETQPETPEAQGCDCDCQNTEKLSGVFPIKTCTFIHLITVPWSVLLEFLNSSFSVH